MAKLHTLRIIMGHPHLNDALLRCVFDKSRTKFNPVRRLWLENCRVSAGCDLSLTGHPYCLPLELDFNGLESVRLRRLPLRAGNTVPYNEARDIVFARSTDRDNLTPMQNGIGGLFMTPMVYHHEEQIAGGEHVRWCAAQRKMGAATSAVVSPLSTMFQGTNLYDRRLWDALREKGYVKPSDEQFINFGELSSNGLRSELMYRGEYLDPMNLERYQAEHSKVQREKTSSGLVAMSLCRSASPTLRSLTIDWALMAPRTTPEMDTIAYFGWVDVFIELFALRLPCLRAFQLRNAVTFDTRLPPGLYLFDCADEHPPQPDINYVDPNKVALRRKRWSTCCLEFMEYHDRLQCLGWPMANFFSERSVSADLDISSRAAAVIDNLGRTLVDLRVDTMYRGTGEPHSESTFCTDTKERDRRRRFIEQFASKMRKVESIKIEGGVPRDERREIVRALHACPLKKVVMIGVCFPIGNTWGADGEDLLEPIDDDEDIDNLPGEDNEAIWKYGPMPLEPVSSDSRFKADYGWSPSPPMLNTIAAYHAQTVTELKFCGYKGAPVLWLPTPITTPLLSALKHFHKLKSLVMSLTLSTMFEDSTRDRDVIDYWLNTRSSDSTALVRVTDEEPEGWERELKTKYAPDAMAWRVTSLLGPFLSERAKASEGGVNIRASVCLGDSGGGIFDLDIVVGKGAVGSDVCLGFKGPREELEPERRRTKLNERRWF
ncbi:hypothetical protein LTR56_023867 [Elasticomyces elasticus]|nr:hypothetical protein LTR56_023867 [Elasticomyces elasticus]KAK3668915.1 hypothetical protein LTR22_000395 [Elasticomyces elasticus]KAK4901488.1 hypothetical protein LTR49_027202 [Elasticomyces elasticus]KAK5754568.1 hypothetical protein LTS12_015292 [Elasticomyces elasticus]